ncbi:MAG TPA: hypothetical protein VK481_13930, partial [Gemmatimonadaceae bacterium]|nr:hypothetical protein [Gemmatimonadaceae bacterium]
MTTAGVIAVGNLEAEINGQASRALGKALTVGERADLIELIALRAQVLGRVSDAERWFRVAMHCYRSTSPFPVAMLEFQLGKFWMEHDDLSRARIWLE